MFIQLAKFIVCICAVAMYKLYMSENKCQLSPAKFMKCGLNNIEILCKGHTKESSNPFKILKILLIAKRLFSIPVKI